MIRLLATAVISMLVGCSSPSSTDGGLDGGPHDADSPALPEIEPCGSSSPEALAGCVDQGRLEEDIALVARPRPPGSEGWQAVQDLCAERLAELGYAVELHDYGTGTNVVGTRLGSEHPEERVVVTAHYDHIPGCIGADDNATGVAGLFEMARVLAMAEHSRTLELFCADEEELGLVGSGAYAARAIDRGEEIVVVYVLDSIGVSSDEPGSQELPFGIDILFPELADELEDNEFRADFFTVLADDLAHEPATLIELYGDAVGRRNGVMELSADIKNDPLLADLHRADHASFWAVDIPALLVSDTTELRDPCYHCRSCPDTVERLDLSLVEHAVQASLGSAATILNRQ